MDRACTTAVAALESDPFYRSICASYVLDTVRRRVALAHYFAYPIEEGWTLGRTVHLHDPDAVLLYGCYLSYRMRNPAPTTTPLSSCRQPSPRSPARITIPPPR